VGFVVWNIRGGWGIAFEQYGPISRDDLAGICRTLLYSIEAHAALTPGGYLGFLQRFYGEDHW
jgi:hypothetical protein